ncbi:MAG: hypothetical protein IJS92_07970 [Paludibacteraceae bacterium]|nr:hypothetical protein [Paludibacteraceae bacterium]
MTTFEDLKPLFREMSPYELQKTADWLVPDASDVAILARAWDIKNHTERHMMQEECFNDYEEHPGVVTYRQQ